jgi:MFS family permease
VAGVALIAMLRMFGLFSLLPVLAVYASTLSGATPFLIGLAVGGYGLTQALLQVPFGALSDRIGRRPVILVGLLLILVGSVLAALSDAIAGVVAGRLLQGAGAVSATLTALVGDTTRPAVRTRSMAVLGIGIGLSFLLALILGPVIAAASGPRSLFWVAAAAALLAALVVPGLPSGAKPGPRIARTPFAVAVNPALLRVDVYVFVLHTLFTAVFVALPFVLANRLQLPLGEHWKIYLLALLASLVGTLPMVFADDRKGRPWLVSVAIALLFAGMLVLIWSPSSVWPVVGALAVFFAGFNFLEAGLPSRASLLASDDTRGAAMGVFASAQFLGAFAGGMLGGLFLGDDNGQAVFVACAVVAGLWLLGHGLLKPASISTD